MRVICDNDSQVLLNSVRFTFNVTIDLRELRGLKERKPEKTAGQGKEKRRKP